MNVLGSATQDCIIYVMTKMSLYEQLGSCHGILVTEDVLEILKWRSGER